MKHHIAVKFLAVALATLSLFAAIGSAACIIGFTAADLYEQSVDDLIEENMHSTRQNLAMHLVHEYASLKLGNLPQGYFYDYWGTDWMYDNFQYGYYFYTILDENGNIVETTADSMPVGTEWFTHTVTDVSFRHVVSSKNVEYPMQSTEVTEVPDTTPTLATEAPAAEETTKAVEATAPTGDPAASTDGTVAETGVPTTEPTLETGVTQPASEPTTDSTEAVSQDVSLPVEDAEDKTRSNSLVTREDVHTESYYDTDLDSWVDFSYFFDKLPPYTVELFLLPGAVTVEPVWDLVAEIWQYRYEMFYVLGISLLLFAVSAVYLCCAAGKKPGSTEVHAAAFNCIPLDVYACGGGFGICLLLLFGVEVVEYLVRYSPTVLVPFVLVTGTGCCLLFVAFCFACAAQFKTPNGYWWRNLLTIRCFALAGKLLMAAVRFLDQKVEPRFVILCKTLWKLTVRIFKAVLKLCDFVFRKLFYFFDTVLDRFFRWMGRKILRFFGILPLTWQWLLVGIGLIMVIAVCTQSHNPTVIIFGLIAAIGIVLYGAHAFGILLESTKRMGKGDLETKVSDQFLLGSFREFAGDLNALADVAVVAAQKQLKSERMKTELITNVSHDIKTPLTSIINYVDLLKKPHTDEEQAEYLEVLSRQSGQLKKLISDLMEMSKASTGNMSVDITAVHAQEAITQALGEFSDKLEKAQLIPVFRQPEEPLYMKADGRLVWRVMSNLLGNAVKYALPGTRLYIDLMELEGKVLISLKNISREELNVSADELLERFVRGDASRNTEGSGLGLNIAQSLMELQKGQLQLLVDGDLFKVTLIFPAVKE